MTSPAAREPGAPNAHSPAGAAFSDTVLATHGRGATPAGPFAPAAASQSRSPGDALRALPVEIQGIWVGLACIVLLVVSAAALRSLFTGNVGAEAAAAASASAAPPAASADAPAASASASAAPSSSATTLAIGGGGNGGLGGSPFGALTIRDRVSKDLQLRKWGPFYDDLQQLLAIEPSAIDRADVRRMLVDATVGVSVGPLGSGPSDQAQRYYTFLTTQAGTAGPDILFEIVTTRGGTQAASYSEELLRRDDVRAKGTPALRVAYDLRVAPACQDRLALFDRVKADGDRRCNQFLFQMARCGKGPTDCCLANDPRYREVVRVLGAKK